ncbi:ferredoxin-type protein NapF [Enterovibrio paralichthyis]|uniref:ferredoxin-type protein NapF n=1 Tax=Enterovibrio paralichthyis TaxID=2853805 RepID=UPI001C48CB08|nr:ferredoxin-type protein NapF [Enterovibrio paralichthyis]MBV7299418.1 ferredoxin-type protein NapF [Enterovibrio paralichthyis]
MVDTRRRFFLRSAAKERVQPMPWIAGWQQFTSGCTRCGDCVRACEEKIIAVGDGGFPTVDFTKGECTFCYACAESCPEGLFQPETSTPWQQHVAIGDACLAKKGVECRSCSDACEMGAIKFQLQLGKVAQPVITVSDCTGCGACVSPCPVNAIAIERIGHE